MKKEKKRKKKQGVYRIKRVDKDIILFGIIFSTTFLVTQLYLDSILPGLEYFYYKRNEEKYVVVDADVIDSREVTVVPGRYSTSLLTRRRNTLKYVIDGIEYTRKIYTYPEVTEPTRITVAVKKDNYTDIRRCVEYHWGIREAAFLFICIFVLGIYIIIEYLPYYFQIRGDRKYMEEHPTSEHDMSFVDQVAEKQLYILEHMTQCKVSENELQKLTEGLAGEWIRFNRGTLWMLTHYGKSQEMSDIFNLLPLLWEEKYCDYIKKMREQGFPENYYILVEQNEKYYCCCEESERLYMYSRGVGLTQTKYGTIYDYIIEQMDNKTEG